MNNNFHLYKVEIRNFTYQILGFRGLLCNLLNFHPTIVSILNLGIYLCHSISLCRFYIIYCIKPFPFHVNIAS